MRSAKTRSAFIGAFLTLCCALSAGADGGWEASFSRIASEAGLAVPSEFPAPPVAPASRAVEPPAPGPALIGAPLDPALLQRNDALEPKAKAEWQARLRANGGKPAFVPLSPIDPTRKLVVCVSGIGFNLEDSHAYAALDGPYQVVILVYNQNIPLQDNAKELADALEALGRYRLALAAARGVAPERELRLVGHSYGAISSEAALGRLAGAGLIGAGPAALFPNVLFICMAAPWRGIDTFPGLASGPAQKAVMAAINRFAPGLPSATVSLVNQTPSMNAMLELRLPPEVDVRLVAPLPVDGTGQRFEGVVGPVDSWYSVELGKGELAKLWRFLREPEGDERELDGHGIGKTEALRQLWLTLERCSLYPAHKAELYAAAAGSATLDEFKARYDKVIAEIVATFHGEHTAFMWEDPAFAPWLSRTLAGRSGGQS